MSEIRRMLRPALRRFYAIVSVELVVGVVVIVLILRSAK